VREPDAKRDTVQFSLEALEKARAEDDQAARTMNAPCALTVEETGSLVDVMA
jgi:hypothetical protein